MHWHVKDQGIKSSMPAVGMLYFTRTRFQNKETKETAYLLDRILGLLPHAHMSDGMKAALLEKAVQTSYEKAGKEACPGECVSRETVMCHVRRLEIPAKSQEEPAVKKETRILYVEADEDVKAMLLYSSKGIETLGAEFVLDGSHIQKYKKDGTPGRGYRGNKGRKQEKNTGMAGRRKQEKTGGMDKMAQLRVYWKNGGGMDRLVQYQKEKKIKEKTEEEICFSATEMITLEKSTEKQTGNT